MVQHDGVQPGVQQTVHPGIHQLDSLLAIIILIVRCIRYL